MRYSFYFDGGENNVYAFETDLKISYEIKFRPSNYLLGDETTVYANHIYEFIISSDGRQELRRRKFDDWYHSEPKYGLMKFDEYIRDSQGNLYPISLIIQIKNPYFIEIIDGFRKIALENNEGK
jgi:hypothetical protein